MRGGSTLRQAGRVAPSRRNPGTAWARPGIPRHQPSPPAASWRCSPGRTGRREAGRAARGCAAARTGFQRGPAGRRRAATLGRGAQTTAGQGSAPPGVASLTAPSGHTRERARRGAGRDHARGGGGGALSRAASHRAPGAPPRRFLRPSARPGPARGAQTPGAARGAGRERAGPGPRSLRVRTRPDGAGRRRRSARAGFPGLLLGAR